MMADILSLAISLLKGVSPQQRRTLGLYLTTVEQFGRMRLQDIEQLIKRPLRYRNPSPAELLRQGEKIARDVCRSGARIISYWSEEYPPLLRHNLYDPPYILYVRGTLPRQDVPSVALVGTRTPSASGRKAAFSLAAELGLAGIPVVSGLAAGIDTAAHWGALKTQQQTAAVMGNGIDSVYPHENRELAARILRNDGALLSEYPPFTPAHKYCFPKRNRIISGMARALVVVQAPEKSGALITADHALDQNKDVYVHSAGTYGTVGAGGLRLSREGAKLLVNAATLLDSWNIKTESRIEPVDQGDLSPERRLQEELDGRLLRFDGLWYRRVG
ncbi:MAG: DNA-processing protein DprA [Spirochaetota bacterium]